jgi:hypothetical protein
MKATANIEEEIAAFLKTRKEKAFTAEEIMGSTSFHVDFYSPETSKTSTFIAANFVAVLNDLVGKGQIARKAVNNRMYFMSTE